MAQYQSSLKKYSRKKTCLSHAREPILIGVRDSHGRYRIPLMQQWGQWQPRRSSKQARKALRQANSVYDLPSTEQAIKWMHAVCGYPVKSTCLKAIKAGTLPQRSGWRSRQFSPKPMGLAPTTNRDHDQPHPTILCHPKCVSICSLQRTV